MRVLVAPDKFKGSLTAAEVCHAVAAGIHAVYPHWQVDFLPLADGGEGTADLLMHTCGGSPISLEVHDPLGRAIQTHYGLSPDGKTAFLEMAAASGLGLLKSSERNPMQTSTIGTGEMVKHALHQGVNKIILGCGGSATNDAGLGMMQALGVMWFDAENNIVHPIGKNLIQIARWQTNDLLSAKGVQFHLITDVRNPLYGTSGAAFTFGQQKGANQEQIALLDAGLKHIAQCFENERPGFVSSVPGCGAAGGLPVSARFFFDATLSAGIDFVLEFVQAEEKFKLYDLIITGEGKLDDTSLQGKTVSGVVGLANRLNKPAWVVCGMNAINNHELKAANIIPLIDAHCSAEQAIQQAAVRIAEVIATNVSRMNS